MNNDIQDQIAAAKAELKIAEEEVQNIEAVQETQPEVVTEPSEQEQIEQQAREMGWTPEYKGPNKKSAEQFVRDGSFFRKIDAQNKKIDELTSVIKKLDVHNQKVAEASYNKGVQDAIQKRREAVEVGDVDAFNKAELELKSLETQKETISKAPVQPVNNAVVTQDMLDFVEENKSWFNNNTSLNARMVKEADGLFMLEVNDNPNMSQKEILKVVKDKLQLLHPDVFENPNKSKPIAVTKSSNTSSGVKSTSALVGRMTESQKAWYKSAASVGISMSIEDYAKQLDQTGDLKND